MKTLVGDLNSKMVKEDISKQRVRNESLHKSSNANGIKVVNFATSKYLVVKGTMFPHHKIYIFWLLLMEECTVRLVKVQIGGR
jgi:ethanolamine utilization protein EutQ (cupin superfamily)